MLHLFFQAVLLIIFAGVVLSWVQVGSGGASWLHSSPVRLIRELSFQILRPFRLFLARVGLRPGPLDFSPMLAWATIALLERMLGIR